MKSLRKKRLGDLLVQSGKLTEEQLHEELNKQMTSKLKLGKQLIHDNILTEDDIIEVLKVQLGMERVYLEEMKLDKKAIRMIPEGLAKKYNMIPIGFVESSIIIAMSDPLNIFAYDDVSLVTGLGVKAVIASEGDIENAIGKQYSSEYVEKAAEELSKTNASKIEETLIIENEEVKNAPVVKLVDSIIDNAIKARASDIHIEPNERYIKIRYRVDGTLREVLRTPKENLAALVTRIKILAGLDIAEKRIPQDGRIITVFKRIKIDLRVSVLPTVHGEKIVIRILLKNNNLLNKEKLGMSEYDMMKLGNMIKSPYGIILVTGPTGSGKSTTLYTVLSELNKPDINIITVEDPVEYMMEGINQVNVNNKAGLTFASGLRAILRQDPDIVMIGEIRDRETAEIAVRSAITGHLVLSTIHTNDASAAIVRLMDMGVDAYLIAAAISGVVAQRLVKVICPKCKEEYIASEYEKNIIGIERDKLTKLYRGVGCSHCGNTGYSGRTGIYEIMEIDEKIRQAIQNGADMSVINKLNRQNGIKTLKESCAKLVLKGVTTVEELAKVAFL
ncbi:ATPase, T2SS/T4P/T4SS family [Clostridium sediminicola]|uniref:GspE/PulE family protein n=1 Tax=Clostridium sediminicola TaxID=3114879 RepID=UPI0031F1CB67